MENPIDVHKLMFGNYVRLDNGKIIKVDESSYLNSDLAFYPIRLSLETLKKNGFKADIYDDTICKLKGYDENDKYYDICIDLKVVNACHIYGEDGKYRYEGAIMYIHELQQMMNSCRVKKEIII